MLVRTICLIAALLMPVAVQSGVPVVESWVVNDNGGSSSSVSAHILKPSGLSEGDLIVLLVASDPNNPGTGGICQDTPSGYTCILNESHNTSDAAIGVFYKVAGASEPDTLATVDISSDPAGYPVTWGVRISGQHATQPDTVGTYLIANSSSITDSLVTVNDSSLVIVFSAFDGSGGAADTATITGTGWTDIDDDNNGTGFAGVVATWGTYSAATADTTAPVTVTYASSDGIIEALFSIRGTYEESAGAFRGAVIVIGMRDE